MQPLRDQLLVEKFESETKTSSGLILTTDSSETIYQGRVIATGQGYANKDGTYTPSVLKPDDHIVFSKTSGFKVKVDDAEYLMLKETDVIGVVSND